MVILGMALGLTNYLVDAGIPDQAIDWVQSVLPNKFAFLVALNLFLLLAGADGNLRRHRRAGAAAAAGGDRLASTRCISA